MPLKAHVQGPLCASLCLFMMFRETSVKLIGMLPCPLSALPLALFLVASLDGSGK